MELTVARELKSPNRWNGRHWRYKHRESQEWEKAVSYTLMAQKGCKGILGALHVLGAFPWQSCEVKQTVTVTRLVPSARNFIRDDDNLRFAVKPVFDALKRLRLIKDDSRKWLSHATPTQEVSTDGKYYTRIVIEAIQ